MGIRINCKYNDRGAWCTNKNIKRSLFGIGARCCVLYPDGISCKYQEKYEKPKVSIPPHPPLPKEKTININIKVNNEK